MTTVTRNTRLINTETQEYPVFLQELKDKIPNACISDVSIAAEALVDFNYVPVKEVEPPAGDVVSEGPPILEDGVYRRNWIVREHTPDEYAALLQQAKDTQLVVIENLRIAQFKIGFPFLAPDGEIYHVQVRDTDRVNILAYRTLSKEAIADGRDYVVNFLVYENVPVTLHATEMVEMADESVTQVEKGYQVIWTLKAQTRAATTIEEIPVVPESIFSL